ncbi:MAG TPA: hypothetical protein VKU41_25610, partial [Polyangiaceae bacterium]|nr:hypothetical protein [Polyangiaceae bacterium]
MPATLGVQPLILVVESDTAPARSLMSAIASQGFRTLRVLARPNAIARSSADASDLVLVDGTHPTLDPVWVTVRLRERTSTP